MLKINSAKNYAYRRKPTDLSKMNTVLKNNHNKGGLAGGATYIAGSALAGIGGVGEGIIDLFSAAGNALAGNTEYAKYVFKDNVVGDWHEDITEEYNPDAVWKFGGDVAHGLGQSSWFLLNLIPGANWVGTATFGAGMVGQGISNAAEQTGDVGLKEVGYGVTTAAIEATLGHFLNGTSTLAKNIGGSIAKSTGKSALKSVASSATRKGLVKSILSDAAGEFAEEFISEYTDTFLQRAYQINPDAETSLQDALYSGFVGAVSGAVSAGSGDVVNAAVNQQRGARIIKNGNSQTLVNTANLVADKLAGSDTNFKNAPQWVKTLRGEVDAYNKLAAKGQQDSLSGQTILGEMQASLFFAEMQAQNAGIQEGIQNASEENRAALAEYINRSVDKSKRKKDYTAEDIAKNTDDVAKQLAIMKQVGYGFDIDGAIYGATSDMAQESAVESVIAEERTNAAQGATMQTAESGVQSEARETTVETQESAVERAAQRAEAGGVQYSIANTLDMSWEDQLKKSKRSDTLVVSKNTPSYLTEKGVSDKPLAIPKSIITKAQSGKDESHSISDQNIRDLPKGIENAIAVIDDKNRNSIIFITNLTEKGKPIIVSMQKDASFDGDDVHQATSIHVRQNLQAYLQKFDADSITVLKQNELDALSRNDTHNGVRVQEGEKPVNKSISQTEPIVNSESEKNIDKVDIGEPKYSLATKKKVIAKQRENQAREERRAAKTAQESGEVSKGAETREAAKSGADGGISATERDSNGASSSVTDKSATPSPDLGKAKGKSRSTSEPKVSEAKESLTDEQRKEKARERAEQWLEWEKKTSPTVKELNTAREFVKEFDNLSNPRRLAIIRMIRSAEGKVDKNILKGVANLMAVLPQSDLEIRFAEDIGNKGLATKVGSKTLLVIDSSTDFKNTIQGTIAHELVHYLENKAGYKEFAAFVRKHAKAETIAEIEKKYNDHYRAVYEAEERAKGISDAEIQKRVADRMATDKYKALIDSEVTATLAGQALNNERFLKRYADRDKKFIQKAFDWLKGTVTALKKKGKDTEEVSEVAKKMMTMMDVIFQAPTVGESNGSKKYSYAGEKAKTADKMKLATAKEMLEGGVDSETVRKETGWFKSYDGKWRFEINDEEMKVSVPTSEHAKVGDVVDHPLLFEAYPELKEIKIRFDDELSDATAVFYPQLDEIVLNGLLKKYPQFLKETLIHEMQHVVQEIEGFAKGSSPEYWVKARIHAEIKYDSLKQDLDQWLDEIGYKRFAEETKARVLAGEISPKERAEALEDFKKNPLYAEELARREAELDKLNKDWPKLHKVGDMDGIATVRDMYYATAGEIEARDAARRGEFTDAQRKHIRPEVDWKHAVFAEDGASYEIKYPRFTQKEIDDNIQTVATMQSVITISEDKLKPTGKAPSVLYEEYFKSLGESIHSEIYGDIAIKRSSVKSEIRHGNTAEKIASMEAIPTVIDQGKVIEIIDKGAGVERLVIAAPIVIGKTDYLMGVMLQRDAQNQRLYLHNVVIKEKTTKSQEVDLLTTGTYNENDRLFITSILQKVLSVNTSKAKNIAKADLADRKYDLSDEVHNENGEVKDEFFEAAVLRSMGVQDSGTSEAESSLKAENEALKAENNKMRGMLEKMAREEAEYQKRANAEVFDKKDVDIAVRSIEGWSREEMMSFAKGYELKGMTKSRREDMISQIYVALHEKSARRQTGPGSIAVKNFAAEIAAEYIDSAAIKGEDGKSYHFSDIYDESTINGFKQELTDLLYGEFSNMGKATSNAEFMTLIRAQKETFRQERFNDAAIAKHAREVSYQALKLRDMADTQKREPATEGLQRVTKALGAVVDPKGNIRVNSVDKAMAETARFLEAEAMKTQSERDQLSDEAKVSEVADVINEELKYKVDEFLRLRKGREGKALSAEEMKLAGEVLRGMKTTIERYNKEFINGHWVDVDAAASESVADLIAFAAKDKEYKTRVGKFLGGTVGKKVNEVYFYNILSPETVVEALEGYKQGGLLKSLYHSVRVAKQRAEHRAVQMKKPFSEFLDDKENRWVESKDGKERKYSYRDKLNKKLINVNGNEITLGEAIYLFMLTKREHAHAGLMEDGFITYDENNQRKSKFKILDIPAARDSIFNQLDGTDRAFLAMAEEFFNKTATKVKKDADMEIFGFTNIQDGYYVPMIRDRYSRMNGVTDARQSVGSIITVYNKSFNQNLVQNAKALEGKNIMSIINDHADGLADYAELYLPLKAFDRVYNRAVAVEGGEVSSIREVLNNKVWNGTEKYLKKLFSDIQGQGEKSDNVIDTIVGKMRSAWVNSVLGANLKVVATQTTSLGAATQVIEPRYITKALSVIGQRDVSELRSRAYQYSDIIEARSFDMGALRAQGNIEKVSKIGEKSGFLIGWMDERICFAIFRAAEIKVEEQTGYAVGTEDNAKRAAKIADEAIYTTQAMTSASERSALQRSKSEIAKLFSMFTSDSVKNLSHLYGNTMKYIAHSQRVKAGETSYEAALETDKKELMRSVRTLAITGVMLGLITQAFKYLYAKEEEEPEDKAKDLTIDVVSSTLNILPIVSDIVDKLVFNYDMSMNVLDVANDTIETLAKGFKTAGKAMSGEYVSTQDAAGVTIDIIKSGASFVGIPVAPVERTITGLLRRVAPSAIYGWDSMFSNPSYTADLKKAVESGDDALAEHILSTLYKNELGGAYTSDELEEIVRLYSLTDEEGKHYNVIPQKIGTEINGVKLTAAQRKKFNSIYSQASGKVNEFIDSAYYGTLCDEQKAKGIKNLYALYYDRAAAEVVGKEWSNAVAYSYLTENYSALFAVQAYKSGLSEQVDARGKKITVRSQMLAYMESLKLSESDYLVVAYANGVKDKETKAAFLQYLNALALSEEIKKQIAERLGFEVKDGRVVEKEE